MKSQLFSNLKLIIFSTIKREDKTNNPIEGFHKWFNTLQIQGGENFKNIFKTINVLRKIYKDEDIKIDEQLAGKKRRKRMAKFETRDEEIIAVLRVYKEQETPETKLRQLHIIASKLVVAPDVLVDIQDENANFPDEED